VVRNFDRFVLSNINYEGYVVSSSSAKEEVSLSEVSTGVKESSDEAVDKVSSKEENDSPFIRRSDITIIKHKLKYITPRNILVAPPQNVVL
jgi:hypothetical protein